METLSSFVSSRTFAVVRRGYDTEEVEAFIARVASAAEELEEAARLAAVRANGLERKADSPREAEAAMQATYLAASETRQRLLEDAEERARRIVLDAESQATSLVAEPRLDAERARRDAEDILRQANARLENAEVEAQRLIGGAQQRGERIEAEADARVEDHRRDTEEILAGAQAEGDRIVAAARTEALATMAESRREAMALISATKAEYETMASNLRSLRTAVGAMLDEGSVASDQIRLILTDEPVASQA